MALERRTRRRTAEVRQLLLDAAGEVFSRKGYAEATTDDIAAEAGVSRTLIFRHFGSKWDLFRESQLQPFLDLMEGFRATWDAQEEQVWDEYKLMHTMVGLMYDSFRAHSAGVLGLASMDMLDPEARRQARELLDKVFAEVVEIGKKEARRRRTFSEKDLDLVIRMIIGTVASMTVLEPLFVPTGRRRPSRAQMVDQLTNFALHGIGYMAEEE